MTKTLNLILCIFVLSLMTPPVIWGQEQHEQSNSLREGAWAMQFAISSNFTLYSFQGGAISAKYHVSKTNAIRVGLTINGSDADNDNLTLPTSFDTTLHLISESTGGSRNSRDIVLNAQYLWYVNPEAIIHLFLGIGCLTEYGHSDYEDERVSFVSDNSWIKSTRSNSDTWWAVGTSGVAGVEWFATSSFSLHAEYGLVLQYRSTKGQSNSVGLSSNPLINPYYNNTKSTGLEKGWVLDNGQSKFGLSVYF